MGLLLPDMGELREARHLIFYFLLIDRPFNAHVVESRFVPLRQFEAAIFHH